MSNPSIQILSDLAPKDIADGVEAFLHQLSGPTLIKVRGLDSSRTRAIVTLLHGNEPSGLRAVHQWLKSGRQPAVNIICLIGSVQAALHEELFKHRMIPGQRDLNRCFKAPFDDYPAKIAQQFLSILANEKPECVIDIHNTSGSGPAFGVLTDDSPVQRTLISLFTQRVVVTDHRLHSLMEISTTELPIVTVECGGADDAAADQIAYQGLQHYLFNERVLEASPEIDQMTVFMHPVRLQLAEHTILAYADEPVEGAHLTIPSDVEKHNFTVVQPDALLAWLGEEGEDVLQVRNAAGADVLSQYFRITPDGLYPAKALKLFMVTSNPTIAMSDCLFYATYAIE